MFQFTHPGKGATETHSFQYLIQRSFNSRTLGRVRPVRVLSSRHCLCVSIHAPWEGCDGASRSRRAYLTVSIHAPWEGCDAWCSMLSNCYTKFQFTHPGKGATGMRFASADLIPRFNSRTLGRVRLRLLPGAQTAVMVSIHAPWEGCDYF